MLSEQRKFCVPHHFLFYLFRSSADLHPNNINAEQQTKKLKQEQKET